MDNNTLDESKTAMWVLHGLISALSNHQASLPWGITEALSTILCGYTRFQFRRFTCTPPGPQASNQILSRHLGARAGGA
jgi:hypothetical protein